MIIIYLFIFFLKAQLKAVKTFYNILYDPATPKEIFDDYMGQVIDFIQFKDENKERIEIIVQNTLSEIFLIFIFKTKKQQKAMIKLLNEYGSDIYIECISIDTFNMNANLYKTCIADQPVNFSIYFFFYIMYSKENFQFVFCVTE